MLFADVLQISVLKPKKCLMSQKNHVIRAKLCTDNRPISTLRPTMQLRPKRKTHASDKVNWFILRSIGHNIMLNGNHDRESTKS